jgi:hypothetical protein
MIGIHMPLRSLAVVLVSIALSSCLQVRPESLVPAEAAHRGPPLSEYLTGAPTTFLVFGDTDSFVWPTMLQDLLDRHARGGVYHVINASSSAGAKDWSDPDALRELLAGALREHDEQAPRVALCQVSLRGIGDERGPVKSEHDMLGAEKGADALERLATALHALGVEHVLFATSPYRQGADPELRLERVALERLLARGHDFVAAGPELYEPTRRYFPDAYAADEHELNEFGIKLLGEEWYRFLAGPEAREELVEALYARDYDVDVIDASHAVRRGFGP